MGENLQDFIGVLEVYVHRARGIPNICIYHNQDVYSKLCITSDPENTVSTQIINGGGMNPIFNQNLRLNVRTIESSLKCEVWMLSRVKNYLEDQFLGFTLVPLSEVLIGNGKLSQEFPLSSSNLFHSPAGFVQLSLSYKGDSPEVVRVPGPSQPLCTIDMQDLDVHQSDVCDYGKIEFPDPRIVNENNQMVSEYLRIQCTTDMDSHTSESPVTGHTDNHHLNSDIGVQVMESFLPDSLDSTNIPKDDTETSSFSTNRSLSSADPTSSNMKDKVPEVANTASVSSVELPSTTTSGQSVLDVNTEPEQSTFQQEIVDIYMKSMQQFTESLAKMKLPVDTDNETSSSGNSISSYDQTIQASKATGSRVFYGSRAFF